MKIKVYMRGGQAITITVPEARAFAIMREFQDGIEGCREGYYRQTIDFECGPRGVDNHADTVLAIKYEEVIAVHLVGNLDDVK